MILVCGEVQVYVSDTIHEPLFSCIGKLVVCISYTLVYCHVVCVSLKTGFFVGKSFFMDISVSYLASICQRYNT